MHSVLCGVAAHSVTTTEILFQAPWATGKGPRVRTARLLEAHPPHWPSTSHLNYTFRDHARLQNPPDAGFIAFLLVTEGGQCRFISYLGK